MKNNLFRQDIVADARFMVVGCGALGNEVLKNLALMGARHLVAVDFDRVEVGNLNRSILFTRQDAETHRRKTEAVAERLVAMNPNLDLTTLDGDIAYDIGLGWLRRTDVVIGCVDSRWARYCINRLCMRAGIPWVDGGISQLEGTVRVFRPGINCYACNLGPEGMDELRQRMPCSGIIRQEEAEGHAPTTSLIASIIGAVQVQEALKLVHPAELANGVFTSLCGQMFYYEGRNLSTRTVAFQAYDEECPIHDKWEPVKETDIPTHITIREAFKRLAHLLNTSNIEIELTDDCFVDFITDRETEHNIPVMRPGRQVSLFVEQDETLHGLPRTRFYQHEYHIIDKHFPYADLTLQQLGLPTWSVLPVTAGNRRHYIELAADKRTDF
ncbi:MAG TPA: ThiF family adenylyltransferase [Candidatus Bacteroides merdigallinarum]|uniref:ThiF family adenylyltransferase n=1 Tax=Candidatus Bacteroides merdigallinarum TaxID=2838473 RepID=A0A9D2J2M6_9BACE|nr:ThiF family adenylyltransferase [Candidatus Bacteroides merdigallinarum]